MDSNTTPSPVTTELPAGRAFSSTLFKSFWMGGFEASYHINRAGVRVDMIAATQHDRLAAEDYARLRAMGLHAARDGVRWHLVDRCGRYDFASLAAQAAAAQSTGIQVIWDLCHYGWPDDLDVFAPAFVRRFERYCAAVAAYLRGFTDEPLWFVPINEISFLTWAIGHRGLMYPFAIGRTHELKRQFVRAAIAGIEAIWSVAPRARIVHVDPVFNVVPPRGRPDLAHAARVETESQFEAWDMLAGLAQPELDGHPRYLDVIGVNYYHANQWELPENRLRWEDHPRDERWLPLWYLLERVQTRYQRPMFIGETSHFGVGRGPWLRELVAEVRAALARGISIEGICLYPIIDRPDWDDPNHWHNCGLWDLRKTEAGGLERVLCADYAADLAELMGTWPDDNGRAHASARAAP